MLTAAGALLAEASDPVTAFVDHDWAALGGWSLFIGLVLTLIIAFFREGIVPGKRVARLEANVKELLDANGKLTTQNGQLITANEITKHFFEETVPKRGEPAP